MSKPHRSVVWNNSAHININKERVEAGGGGWNKEQLTSSQYNKPVLVYLPNRISNGQRWKEECLRRMSELGEHMDLCTQNPRKRSSLVG